MKWAKKYRFDNFVSVNTPWSLHGVAQAKEGTKTVAYALWQMIWPLPVVLKTFLGGKHSDVLVQNLDILTYPASLG